MKQRIEIGFVALRPDGRCHGGVHHAGPKIYKTLNLAKAAVRKHGVEYEFFPAFIEVETGVPDGDEAKA
jgi:hypothetical protein